MMSPHASKSLANSMSLIVLGKTSCNNTRRIIVIRFPECQVLLYYVIPSQVLYLRKVPDAR